jgi:dUTP pyrophosphatase
MVLHIKRLDATLPLPGYATADSAAFDLSAAEDIEVPAGAVRLVRTGLVIGVPSGYFLAIFARSSTPLKRGLMVANGVGVVDADYRGPEDEVKIPIVNITHSVVHVARGDRLAQAIVLPAPRVEWEEVNDLAAPTRGGFGSTGG